jgi:dehydrogenase/reductase SDR family protein 1
MLQVLQGKIAVVAGASRGVGKGVALALGEAGATVYVTGRTVQVGANSLPGTIVQTAEEVTRLGGQGIAVRCDHCDDAAVEALFQRVRHEQGHLDILVNNVFAFPGAGAPKGTPFWELPIALWDQFQYAGVRTHYVASVLAAPLMIAQRRGLIVNISSHGGGRYQFDVAYGVAMAAIDRLAADMAHELRSYGVAAISLWPWLVETERVRAYPAYFAPQARPSAQFVGRAVAALAADPQVMDKTGQVLLVPELAEEYGFTDLDGTRPAVPPDIAALRASRRT